MKKFKISLMVFLVGIVLSGALMLYLFNMPHQDVIGSKADYEISATELVSQYLQDPISANNKYLSEDGQSKILLVKGIIKSITEDFSGMPVVLLQDEQAVAGVSCTFTEETKVKTKALTIGQQIKIKGVIRSGAAFDDDLGMYEHVLLDKSSIIN